MSQTIAVGKIYLLDTLVAIAIYENNRCNNFAVLNNIVEELFETHRVYLKIPDILQNMGFIGTYLDFYEYLSGKSYMFRNSGVLDSEIRCAPLEYYTREKVKELLADNQQLKPVT